MKTFLVFALGVVGWALLTGLVGLVGSVSRSFMKNKTADKFLMAISLMLFGVWIVGSCIYLALENVWYALEL